MKNIFEKANFEMVNGRQQRHKKLPRMQRVQKTITILNITHQC